MPPYRPKATFPASLVTSMDMRGVVWIFEEEERESDVTQRKNGRERGGSAWCVGWGISVGGFGEAKFPATSEIVFLETASSVGSDGGFRSGG